MSGKGYRSVEKYSCYSVFEYKTFWIQDYYLQQSWVKEYLNKGCKLLWKQVKPVLWHLLMSTFFTESWIWLGLWSVCWALPHSRVCIDGIIFIFVARNRYFVSLKEEHKIWSQKELLIHNMIDSLSSFIMSSDISLPVNYKLESLYCITISVFVVLSFQFSSVAQSCPTLCEPMDYNTLGLPVHHQLPELAESHAHQVSDAIQPSHPLSFPSLPAFSHSQHQGLFQWVSSSHQMAKVLEFQLQHQAFQWIFRIDFL